MNYDDFRNDVRDLNKPVEPLIAASRGLIAEMLGRGDGLVTGVVDELRDRLQGDSTHVRALIENVFGGIADAFAGDPPSEAVYDATQCVEALVGALPPDGSMDIPLIHAGFQTVASPRNGDLARGIVKIMGETAKTDRTPETPVANAFVTQGVQAAAAFARAGEYVTAIGIFRLVAGVAGAVPTCAPGFIWTAMNVVPDLVGAEQDDAATRFVHMTEKLVVKRVPTVAGEFLDAGFTAVSKVLSGPDHLDRSSTVLQILEQLNEARWRDTNCEPVFLERGVELLPAVAQMDNKRSACYLFMTLARTAVRDVCEDIVCRDFARIADPVFHRVPMVVCFGPTGGETGILLDGQSFITLERMKNEEREPRMGPYRLFATSAFSHLADPPTNLPTAAEFIRSTAVYKKLVGEKATP